MFHAKVIELTEMREVEDDGGRLFVSRLDDGTVIIGRSYLPQGSPPLRPLSGFEKIPPEEYARYRQQLETLVGCRQPSLSAVDSD